MSAAQLKKRVLVSLLLNTIVDVSLATLMRETASHSTQS